MAVTRATTRKHVRVLATNLPSELWIEVLSHLDGRDIARAVCSTQAFASIRDEVWRVASDKRWSAWTSLATSPQTNWKRQYEIFELREKELDAVPSVADIQKTQQVVNARHRMVLTEWLAEVSWDWNLESTIVFKAVSYLDHYLAKSPVQELSRFQLVGIACLRAAMGDTSKRLPIKLGEQDKDLEPQRFAYISDRTYTAQQVEDMTNAVSSSTPERVKDAPNAKMFLRSFWYRLILANLVDGEEMHIYTAASFFLQLSLLDLDCSAFSASLAAAAALSAALEIFNKEAWPAPLQQYAAYTMAHLAPCKSRLLELQATVTASHLRQIWRQNHESHSYDEYKEHWQQTLLLVSCPSCCL